MRPYKRAKERYAVQVRNLTTYADSMGEALTTAKAMQDAAFRRGEVSRWTGERIYPVSTITPLGAHRERPTPPAQGDIYGDDELCSFITGLDEVQTDPAFTEQFDDNFTEAAYPEAYWLGRDYGRGVN